MLAKTPSPPYYAVIFSAIKTSNLDGYEEKAKEMVELASQQDGFLGIESAQEGFEITISYWKDEASIRAWQQNVNHRAAQEKGKSDWYEAFEVRVSKVERAYSFKQ